LKHTAKFKSFMIFKPQSSVLLTVKGLELFA